MNLEDALERVRPEVLHCPPDLMIQQLRDALRDFCNFTRAWTYEVENETIGKQVSDYDIELPGTYAEPIAVEYLKVDGVESIFKTVAWLDQNIADWRHRSADDFRYYTQLQRNVITFPCVPTKNGTAGGMYYRVCLRPVIDATEIEDAFWEEWGDTVSCRAKARLQAMPDKPWTSRERAKDNEGYYLHDRGLARIRILQSRGNAAQHWSNPGGFA